MMTKGTSLTAALATVMLIAAACGSAPPSGGGEAAPPAGGAAQPAETAPKPADAAGGTPPANAKRVAVELFYGTSLPHGTPNLKENKALDYLREQVGADLQLTFYDHIYEDKLRVKIASGEIPDAFEWGKIDDFLLPMIKSKAIVPVDEYLDRYPNLKAQKHLYVTKYNGQVYAVSNVRNPIASPDIPLIRQDWLDNLGLKAPTTVDELYAVAKAFRDNDPDRNGKKDTYGIQIAKNLDGTWGVKLAFGVNADWMKEDGKVVPYFQTQRFKEYLAWMRKAFKDGLLDPDFAVTDHIAAQTKLTHEGKAGIFFHYATRPYEFYDGIFQANPQAKLVGFPAVKGPHGDQGVRARVNMGGTFISAKAAKDPEKLDKIFKWLDFGASKEGIHFHDYGVEGVHHTKKSDGTYEIKQDVFEKEFPQALMNTTIIQDTNEVYMNKKYPQEWQDIVRNAHLINEKFVVYDDTKSIFSPTAAKTASEAGQFMIDNEIKAIMGQIRLEDWDQTVQQWYQRFNGEQIVKEVAEAM